MMSRNISLDILKVFLAILVVLIHLSFLRDKMVLVSQLLVNGICRQAVPIFLVISGYYFYSIKSKEKLFEWIKRLIILYILWMFIYCYRWIGEFSFKQSIFVLGAGYLHLWYLIGTLFAGIILYVVKSKKWLAWCIIILFFLGYFIQLLLYLEYFNKDFYEPYLSRNFLFFCFPFMGIGYLLADKKNNRFSPSLWVLFFVLLLVLAESYISYKFLTKGGLVSFDLMLTSLLAAPLIFLYVKNKQVLGNSKNIALYSTAIYLIHPIVLHHIILLDTMELSSIVQKLLVFALIFLFSYILVLINKKLKFIL